MTRKKSSFHKMKFKQVLTLLILMSFLNLASADNLTNLTTNTTPETTVIIPSTDEVNDTKNQMVEQGRSLMAWFQETVPPEVWVCLALASTALLFLAGAGHLSNTSFFRLIIYLGILLFIFWYLLTG